jgi:dienelactone hydrolase
MMRAALLAIMVACAATQTVAAEDYHREELRIPMSAAGPRGLEAFLIRPSGTQAYPLALISHGAPVDPKDRRRMSPYWLYRQAVEFARRGFAALVVMRRGYGDSDTEYAESSCCKLKFYMSSAKATSADLRAAIAAMKGRADVTTQGMIAVGNSAGGYASVALAADPPPGLAAVINFAGGRHWLGQEGINVPDAENALVGAFKAFGARARKPMLWIYAANDSFFGPDLVRRMHDAFMSAGGRAQLINAPAFGNDGHFLFSKEGIPIWTVMVDDFLRAQNLGARDVLAAPTPARLAPPPRLSEKGRAGFEEYLAAGPHKAFAVSPGGAYGYFSGMRSAAEALSAALTGCAKHVPDCAPYAIDNQLSGKADGGPL